MSNPSPSSVSPFASQLEEVQSATTAESHATLTRYYELHAKIYDATRWSFLFGRNAIVETLKERCRANKILEVGCGTGKNLYALAEAFPDADITGVDVSTDMLAVAQRNLAPFHERIQLVNQPYGSDDEERPRYDLILFSYALTMFNPGWEQALADAHADLFLDGTIAVVDFHATWCKPFERWMSVNHVRMDGHLLPHLQAHFTPVADEVAPAYGGLWDYFLFVGRK